MEQMDIKQKIIEMLTEIFPDSGVDMEVFEYVDLIDDLGLDSLTFISIVIEIEDTFDIIVQDEMLMIENFHNLDSIIHVIESAKCVDDDFKRRKAND